MANFSFTLKAFARRKSHGEIFFSYFVLLEITAMGFESWTHYLLDYLFIYIKYTYVTEQKTNDLFMFLTYKTGTTDSECKKT